MKFRLLLMTFCLFLVGGLSANASPDHQARLDAAIANWLSDQDHLALPELAALAEEGNRESRILLGQIARRQQGKWLRGLERSARNQLLRAPGGLSGTSWLQSLVEAGDLHALALHTAFRPPFDFAKIQALIEHQEIETAIRLALRFVDQGGVQAEFAALPQAFGRDGAYAAYLPIIHHKIIKNFKLKGDPADPAIWTPDALLMFGAFLNASGREATPPVRSWLGIVSGDALAGDPSDAEVVGQMIDRLPETQRNLIAVRQFCDQRCPDSRHRCLATVTVLNRTGFNGLWQYSSPSNEVIPPEAYYGSRRAVTEIQLALEDRLKDYAPRENTRRWTRPLQCLGLNG